MKKGSSEVFTRTLVFGISPSRFGLPNPVAVTVIRYTGDESLKTIVGSVPAGLNLVGIVEFEQDEEQELYSV